MVASKEPSSAAWLRIGHRSATAVTRGMILAFTFIGV